MTVDLQVPSTRERLLDAASRLIELKGWAAVTMARIGQAAGVSRQTVYNELGAKRQLAEHLALRELDRFLDVVRARMTQRDDLVEAITWTCQGVLEHAETSVLVRTIVGSIPGQEDPDLLAILTVESGEIIDSATAVVLDCVLDRGEDLPLTEAELRTAVEAVVRLILSSITRPSKAPAEAAVDIGWLLDLALSGARVRSNG